ncbi:unnamed protein product [Merluccius merluccius]
MVNDSGADTTTEKNTDKRKEEYGKELTVEVEEKGNVSMMDVLKEVKKECGEVVGCREGDGSEEEGEDGEELVGGAEEVVGVEAGQRAAKQGRVGKGGSGRAKEERLRSGGEKGKEEKGDEEEMEGVGMAARLNIKRKAERDRVKEERIKGPRPDCKST